jgi:hypothetical protein
VFSGSTYQICYMLHIISVSYITGENHISSSFIRQKYFCLPNEIAVLPTEAWNIISWGVSHPRHPPPRSFGPGKNLSNCNAGRKTFLGKCQIVVWVLDHELFYTSGLLQTESFVHLKASIGAQLEQVQTVHVRFYDP